MLNPDQVLALCLFAAVATLLAGVYLTIRVLRWLVWRAVRIRVRSEINAALRHAVMVKRGAKGQFAK